MFVEHVDRAGLLPETLDDPYSGDGLLHVLGEVGGALLRRPGGSEQSRAHEIHHHRHSRNHHQRDRREQRRQYRHHHDGEHELHQRARRERRHRQQTLHELQVGDRARHHLPGSNLILAGAVESLQRSEQLQAQVVLHAEGQPAGQHPPGERGAEAHHCEDGQSHRDRGDLTDRAGTGCVHRVAGE